MKRMDEMEMSIYLKAINWTWGYTTVFLLIWVIYDYIQTGILGLGFILLLSRNLVRRAIKFFWEWKLGKYEE